MLLVASSELIPSICMRRAAEVFEGIGRRHTAEPGAHAVGRAHRQPFHEPAAERIADAGRILDAVRRDRWHVLDPLRV